MAGTPTIFDTDYQYSNYNSIVTSDNKNMLIPKTILNDINLLYSYYQLNSVSEEDFYLQGSPVIDNMIYNVVHTVIGTREFEPEFGSKVLIMIEEQAVQSNLDIIELELFSCIKRWVPFATLIFKQTYCVADPDNNLVTAFINYVDIFHGLNRNFEMDLIK